MGLLDDAIREHLDLKRRRGADPSEVEREEAEALGPVRREQPRELQADVADGPPADHQAGLDEPAAAYADDVPDYEHLRPSAPSAQDHYEPEPAAHREPPVPAEPPQTHDAPYAEDEDESATPPHGDPLQHQSTREFSRGELDEALGEQAAPARRAPNGGEAGTNTGRDDDGGEDEDVLEETPDFLQETPEHDRLWFEQKPPKDFDF
jgi:hypothetical protein